MGAGFAGIPTSRRMVETPEKRRQTAATPFFQAKSRIRGYIDPRRPGTKKGVANIAAPPFRCELKHQVPAGQDLRTPDDGHSSPSRSKSRGKIDGQECPSYKLCQPRLEIHLDSELFIVSEAVFRGSHCEVVGAVRYVDRQRELSVGCYGGSLEITGS